LEHGELKLKEWNCSIYLQKGDVSNAMKKQMVAERRRRGEFIKSEGNKTAMRLRAEGNKMVSVNMGIAKSEATRKQSEGESVSKIELARAESISLETVNNALKGDGSDQSEYMIAQKYIDMLLRTGKSIEQQVIYLPYPVQGIEGLVGEISKTYGNFTSSVISPLSSNSFSNFQSSLEIEDIDLLSFEQQQQPLQSTQFKTQITITDEKNEFFDLN